jgi:hypothetical protein
MQKAMIAGFTTAERDYIRRELDPFFSTLPKVANGFLLKTWRSRPQAGQPKLPLPARGPVERGLMRIDTTQRWPRLLIHRERSGDAAHNDDGPSPRRPGAVGAYPSRT